MSSGEDGADAVHCQEQVYTRHKVGLEGVEAQYVTDVEQRNDLQHIGNVDLQCSVLMIQYHISI